MSATGDRIEFDDRVIIVTGAGRGMGAAHAKALAARGARVIVNDLGCDTNGIGSSSEPSEEVAAAIVDSGGTALPDMNDIGSAAGCEALIKRAIGAYGRLDGVLHNAGIVHVATLADTTEPDFERMLRVHLYGAYNLTVQGWPHLTEAEGRVLYITSAVGLYGAPFHGMYAAAKMGVIGLARTAAIEGRSSGLCVNALGVSAATRLMLDQMDDVPDLKAWFVRYMFAELPAAASVWLLHPDCTVTGRVFEAWGPHMAEVLVTETRGFELFGATPEAYRDQFAEVEARDGVVFPGGFEDFHDQMFRWIQEAGADPITPASRAAFIPPSETPA